MYWCDGEYALGLERQRQLQHEKEILSKAGKKRIKKSSGEVDSSAVEVEVRGSGSKSNKNKSEPSFEEKTGSKSGGFSLDIKFRLYDAFARTFDSLRPTLDKFNEERFLEQDAPSNNDIGSIEDRILTHGISIGVSAKGVYGALDMIYNANSEEYLIVDRGGVIKRFDWALTPLPDVKRDANSNRYFNKFIHIAAFGHYICWTKGKNSFFIAREDFSFVTEFISLNPINGIFYTESGKNEDSSVEFFLYSKDNLNKYTFNIASNLLTMQESIKFGDMENDNAEIEKVAFDKKVEEKKQLIYLTFNNNCTVIDGEFRIHGTRRNIHDVRISAIIVSSDKVNGYHIVTGDIKGNLKLWGIRFNLISEIRPYAAKIMFLIEHPSQLGCISFTNDQRMFAWRYSDQGKMEKLKTPESIEKIAINTTRKSFLTLGPRKLMVWKMDNLFVFHCALSSPFCGLYLQWPSRVVAMSLDNSFRLINTISGTIVTTALIDSGLPAFGFCGESENLYILCEVKNSLPEFDAAEEDDEKETMGSNVIQVFETTSNPANLKETFQDIWETALTTIAFYDPESEERIVEKEMNFNSKKKESKYFQEKQSFIIAGRRDGCVCRINLETGKSDFVAPCHKGQVYKILVNSELSQFVSIGMDPNIRLWKISVHQDEKFESMLDINWKYSIRHVALVREHFCFALSHHESSDHNICIYNCVEGERFNNRGHTGHSKEIFALSSSKELALFCSASLDETVRIWNEKCQLLKCLCLNTIPTFASFATKQGDIFIGVENTICVIYANKYLPFGYRNRVMSNKRNNFSPGKKEEPISMKNTVKYGQDPRLDVALNQRQNEAENEEGAGAEGHGHLRQHYPPRLQIPKVTLEEEGRDSKRAKDIQWLQWLENDRQQIIIGNHPRADNLPDFRKMTKAQLDEYGKNLFGDDSHKMFISEARRNVFNQMLELKNSLDSFENVK